MEKQAIFRLHFIVFLWGFTAILGKLISVGAEMLVFYRMLFASGFLFLFLRIIRKQSIAVSWKLFFQLVGVGALMGFHWLFFFQSIKVANVSIALVCLSLSTLFASILEPIIYRRRIDVYEVLMGIVMLVCIYLIFSAEIHFKEGIIYGIIAAFLGTLFSVFNGRLYGKTSSGNIIFYEIFTGWSVLSIYYLFSGIIFTFSKISYTDLALLTLLAGVFTAYPMFESIRLMRYITPFTLVLTVNLEPVYGIILACFIIGDTEYMSPIFYVASLAMIASIVINGGIKARKRKKHITLSE